MRLDKFLCQCCELTRNEAKKLLKQELVQVDGVIQTNGKFQLAENAQVLLDGEPLTLPSTRYIMLNKPLDTICSNIDELYPSVLHFVDLQHAFSLIIAGRLDADTSGLLLLTDDGQWAHRITSPKRSCFKRYRVTTECAVTKAQIAQLEQGVMLHGENQATKPAKVEQLAEQQILLSISEGKYHQVKRMLAAVGNKVLALHREAIGSLTLDESLQPGQWRYLTADEINQF